LNVCGCSSVDVDLDEIFETSNEDNDPPNEDGDHPNENGDHSNEDGDHPKYLLSKTIQSPDEDRI
jgi:hypothetical protein